MSEIEALLSVDAGHTPPATVAFFARDAEASERLTYAVLGAMTAWVALISGLLGGPDLVGALLVLTAAMFSIVATPTIKDPSDEAARPIKRHVMVVTSEAIIVRDAWGLRSWRFEDLAEHPLMGTSQSQKHVSYRPTNILQSIGIDVLQCQVTVDAISDDYNGQASQEETFGRYKRGVTLAKP